MVSDYEEGRKMTSLTTGQRLADFLGAEMLADKGLNCKLVIANRPYGCPVTDRAIPTMIFKAEPLCASTGSRSGSRRRRVWSCAT